MLHAETAHRLLRAVTPRPFGKKLIIVSLVLSVSLSCAHKSVKNNFTSGNSASELLYDALAHEGVQGIFIDKISLKKTMLSLSDRYSVNLDGSKDLQELDSKMQNTMLRSKNAERADMKKAETSHDFNPDDTFNSGLGIESHIVLERKTPVILGSTYIGMVNMLSQIQPAMRSSKVIILVSDRPMFPNDFDSLDYDTLANILTMKTKKYANMQPQIKNFAQDYTNDTITHPLVKKVKFYVNLVSLIDKKAEKLGNELLRDLYSRVLQHGHDSHETDQAIVNLRSFIYNVVNKYVPTEKDLAKIALDKLGFQNYTILEQKTDIVTQNRATTADTYSKFITHIKQNDLKDFVLVGMKPFIYRQWLELAFMLKQDSQYTKNLDIDYIALDNPGMNDAIFADEFARLVHVAKLNTHGKYLH